MTGWLRSAGAALPNLGFCGRPHALSTAAIWCWLLGKAPNASYFHGACFSQYHMTVVSLHFPRPDSFHPPDLRLVPWSGEFRENCFPKGTKAALVVAAHSSAVGRDPVRGLGPVAGLPARPHA